MPAATVNINNISDISPLNSLSDDVEVIRD